MQPEKRNQQPEQPPLREFVVEVTYRSRHTYTGEYMAKTPEDAEEIARLRFNRTYKDTCIFESAKVLP